MTCTYDPVARINTCLTITYPPKSLAEQITDWAWLAVALIGAVAMLIVVVGMVLSLRGQAGRDRTLAQTAANLDRLADRIDGPTLPKRDA